MSTDKVLTLSGQILLDRISPVKAYVFAIFYMALLYLQAYLYTTKSYQGSCSFSEDLEIGNL